MESLADNEICSDGSDADVRYEVTPLKHRPGYGQITPPRALETFARVTERDDETTDTAHAWETDFDRQDIDPPLPGGENLLDW
jgi:hypothetical protein